MQHVNDLRQSYQMYGRQRLEGLTVRPSLCHPAAGARAGVSAIVLCYLPRVTHTFFIDNTYCVSMSHLWLALVTQAADEQAGHSSAKRASSHISSVCARYISCGRPSNTL
jgi:hypothetical protein